MRLLEYSSVDEATNLALDEALLLQVATNRGGDVLRLWEPSSTFVVVGRGSRLECEVDVAECLRQQIPILRRASGGAAIVTGPGCLMYSLVLHVDRWPQVRTIPQTHTFVLAKMSQALATLQPGVSPRGTSDLTTNDARKFSGNSMKMLRTAVLYHGTILYNFALSVIGQLLPLPPRQPEYRGARGHAEFVTNFPASREAIRGAIVDAWGPCTEADDWPHDEAAALVADRYGKTEWIYVR